MAYTAGFSVTVGNPTKASDISTLSANDDYLKAITDALLPTTGNLTNYVASNNSDPTISLGTSATNRLLITSDIASGSQELDAVTISTVTAASAGDAGKIVFAVDSTTIATIDDGGIDLAASKAFTVNGSAVTTSPAGSDHQVQWNDSGSFGASANFTFDGSTLVLSGDQTNYEDANDANNTISLGTSATERLEIKAINGSGNKTLEELRFTTKTASGTANHGAISFHIDDNAVSYFSLYDTGPAMGMGQIFAFEYDLINLTGASNPPFVINTTGTKKLTLKDTDDSSLIWSEGATERASATWDASADALVIDNIEESTAVSIGPTIAVTGAITATGDITSTSDVRLKSDVKTIEKATDKIDKLRGVTFFKDGKKSIGVVAQEVEKVIPEVVYTDQSKDKIKNVAYGNMVGLLIEGMKEQQKEIDRLKLIVTGLGNKLR
ncbi:MAG: hypothetical protein CL524_09080 [Aequorivita sp.]|nr:hypothetical protein [Aequorivita sp.]